MGVGIKSYTLNVGERVSRGHIGRHVVGVASSGHVSGARVRCACRGNQSHTAIIVDMEIVSHATASSTLVRYLALHLPCMASLDKALL